MKWMFAGAMAIAMMTRTEAALPPEVEELVARNEASQRAIAAYSYELTFDFRSYDQAPSPSLVGQSGHTGTVRFIDGTLITDFYTLLESYSATHPQGYVRNRLRRGKEGFLFTEFVPQDSGNEAFTQAIYCGLSEKQRPDLGFAVEGSKSFDLFPFAFSYDRFRTLRESLERMGDGARFVVTNSETDSVVTLECFPKNWKTRQSCMTYRFDANKNYLITSKTLYEQDGRVYCQRDVQVEQVDGTWFPVYVSDARWKADEKTGEMRMFRIFEAAATNLKVGGAVASVDANEKFLGLRDENYVHWVLADGTTMQNGMRLANNRLEPLKNPDDQFVDSMGKPVEISAATLQEVTK